MRVLCAVLDPYFSRFNVHFSKFLTMCIAISSGLPEYHMTVKAIIIKGILSQAGPSGRAV